MKLKNKKTGEIVEFRYLQSDHVAPLVLTTYENDKPEMYTYNSLAELCEEWEDYKEPIQVYIEGIQNVFMSGGRVYIDYATAKEAELAVRKLKAWKRLKDKGFRFTDVAGISNNIFVSFETDSKYRGGHVMYDEHSNTDNKLKEYNEDLTLLFGGEEFFGGEK